MLCSALLLFGSSSIPLQPDDTPGGWSDVSSAGAGAEHELAAFALTQLQAANTSETADCSVLAGATLPDTLGSAQTQVVSGINHRMTATLSGVGELELQIYVQSWTETVEVTEAMLDNATIASGVSLDYAACAASCTTACPSTAHRTK